MNGLAGETLAVGAVVIFGVQPVTNAALAIVRELRKPRASRATESAGGAGESPALPAAPPVIIRDGHAVRSSDEGGWVCRCGTPLAPTREAARQVMKSHRAALNGAAA